MAPSTLDKPKQPAMPPQVFRVGTYDAETNDYDQTVTMTAGQVNFPNYTLTPNGWLQDLWFLIECTTAANAATVVFAADAPFSAIAKITFKDVGNREIFGPLTGYDWMTIMKFGGYHAVDDPRADITFSTTAGAGGTGGSFSMVMYLPLEIVTRDSLGAVENKSSSSSFRVEIVLAASTAVYTTPPTTLGTVRVRITEDGYTEPEAADGMGRPLSQAPPAAGTIQYWVSENAVKNAGAADYLVQNGLGYSIRTMIFKLLDTTNTRATGDADWPDPVTLTFGKIQLFQRYKKLWMSRMGKSYRLTNTATDAALGRELGVFPVWFNEDFGFQAGAELRNSYLVTRPGNVLKWSGTIGGAGAHTLFTAVNYVIPPGNDPARLRASR